LINFNGCGSDGVSFGGMWRRGGDRDIDVDTGGTFCCA
jgi:hypothetical protein